MKDIQNNVTIMHYHFLINKETDGWMDISETEYKISKAFKDLSLHNLTFECCCTAK